MNTPKRDYGFEPHGLAGWRVFLDTNPRSRGWVFKAPADFPNSFSWSDEAQDHVIPIYRDWNGPFSGPDCKTAKAAVAAAYGHRDFISKHMAEKGIAA